MSSALISNGTVNAKVYLLSGPAGPAGPPSPGSGYTGTAAINIGGHRALAFDSSSNLVYADNSSVANLHTYAGISLSSHVVGDTVPFFNVGEVSEPTWNWVPRMPVYLGINGMLTQSYPTSPLAYFGLVIGLARTPTTVVLSVNIPIIL